MRRSRESSRSYRSGYAFGYTACVLVPVTLMGLAANATITLARGLIR